MAKKSGKESSEKELPKYKKRINESVNSRVYVDYSGKKPKITFDVPSRKRQRKTYVGFGIFIVILLSLLAWVGSYSVVPSIIGQLSNANLTDCYGLKIINYTYSNQLYFECKDDKGRIYNDTLLYSHSSPINILGSNITMSEENFGGKDIYINGEYKSILFYFLPFGLLAFILLWPLRKFIGHIMTRNDGDNVKSAYKWTFTPAQVFKKDGKWICEIPGFRNIILEYDTTEDFKKYLLKINILDLPVYKLPRNTDKFQKRRWWKLRKHRIKKPVKSVFFWKAEFIFKQKPLKGAMICQFD